MAAVGFGLLTTAVAVGGIIGTAVVRRARAAVRARRHHAGRPADRDARGISSSPSRRRRRSPSRRWSSSAIHGFVWGTTSTVVRQRAVPNELLGRVGGVYRVAIVGGIVIGTPIGGLLARQFGITAPFWFGFVGSAVLVAILWRQFDNIVHSQRGAARRLI